MAGFAQSHVSVARFQAQAILFFYLFYLFQWFTLEYGMGF